MSGKWGGGGTACVICTKTVYPAETVQFEKKPYHIECFKCTNCEKKTDASHAAQYEEKIYCKQCFTNLGFAQKQRQVKWTPKEGGAEGSGKSGLGGGGTNCKVCEKVVYPAETVLFEKTPYHAECFKCTSCETLCKTSGAALFEEKVYCKKCFEREGFAQKQRQVKWEKKEGGEAGPSKFGGGGNPCFTCGKTVYPAETVSYDKKIFHADCLCCSECSKKCNPSNCAMFEDKVYCTLCFERGGYREKQLKAGVGKKDGATSADPRFAKFGGGGNKCRTCAETVYPAETILFEKNAYHQKCFCCLHCKKELDPSGAEHDGPDVYCKKCFHELGLNRARLTKHEDGGESAPAESAPAESAPAEAEPAQE